MSPEDLITDLSLVWASLLALGGDLTAADWERPTECPGWTVRDQYAHMIGTESALLGQMSPAPLQAPHAKNPMGELNEGWVDTRRGEAGPDVLTAFRSVTDRRLQNLRALTPGEWDAPMATPTGPGTYASFMEIRIFDCWAHEQDVRRAVGRPGHLDGPAAEVGMDRMTGSLGFVVGKRVGAAEGTSVVVDLGPPLARRLAVEVAGGRAKTVPAPDSPSVVIRTDGETWLRLAGGRCTGAEAVAAGQVTFAGDATLGRAVVDNLAIVP